VSVDPNRPSAARIYDYYLGGGHNFAVDRAVAERVLEVVPEIRAIARANRAFLRRAVRYATDRGIRQFLDIGSGIPTAGNVHEIARAADPAARVVYADIDPTAVVHARRLLADDPQTAVIGADLLHAEALLTDPALRSLLDLDEPVCVLLIAVLHFLPDTPDLHAALRCYRDALAPGSLLAVSHATPSLRAEDLARFVDLYTRTGTAMVLRDRDELLTLLEGWSLVEPGLVYGPAWRPDEPVADPAAFATLAAVGELP
jgi:SAM-dependent methyltransferase